MSTAPGPDSGSARRRRAISLLWIVALVGAVMGAGLALGTNVSGAVLAVYGLVLALLAGSAVLATRRAASHSARERPNERRRDPVREPSTWRQP